LEVSVNKRWAALVVLLVLTLAALAATGCGSKPITDLGQLEGKQFAVPSGTVADKLVQSKFPEAKFKYYDTALDACLAVKDGKADAAAYDQPILKNIAAKYDGLTVLSEMITTDNYGFAVALDKPDLKAAIDQVVQELKDNGTYADMTKRWLPDKGDPAAMPVIKLGGTNGVLKFGTAAVTEPFSFLDASKNVVGFDVELATHVAQKLGMSLQVVNMDFGQMIPALQAGQVDMIGACITITAERAKLVLFSAPYYRGGIAALVRK
jgi:polar amino acid transport system substrate-binding protein